MQAENPQPSGQELITSDKEKWKKKVVVKFEQVKEEATALHKRIVKTKRAYGDKLICALYALGIHLHVTKSPYLDKYYRFCIRNEIFTDENPPWKNPLMKEFNKISREDHQKQIDMFLAIHTYNNVVCEDKLQKLRDSLAELSQSFGDFMNDHLDDCPVGWDDERTEFLRQLSQTMHATR